MLQDWGREGEQTQGFLELRKNRRRKGKRAAESPDCRRGGHASTFLSIQSLFPIAKPTSRAFMTGALMIFIDMKKSKDPPGFRLSDLMDEHTGHDD